MALIMMYLLVVRIVGEKSITKSVKTIVLYLIFYKI